MVNLLHMPMTVCMSRLFTSVCLFFQLIS